MVSLLETVLEANSHAKPVRISIREDLSHCLPSETLFRFHTYLAGRLLVKIPPKTEPLLFSCVLANIQRVISTPCSCDFLAGLHRRQLHPLPIDAPTPFKVSLD